LTLVKIMVNALGQGYQWYRAKETRPCRFGDTIMAGETYVRFYTVDKTVNPPKVSIIGNVCTTHLHRCEECGAPMLNHNNERFCSESCGQRHFNQEQVEAEENTFWEEE
jgi:hypothetical protein